MSLSRQAWLDAYLEALRKGRFPVPLREIGKGLGATKGSFYSPGHFPGRLRELYEEVIHTWSQDCWGAPPRAEVSVVRDPVERLRMLIARGIDTAPPDGAMRRYAATASDRKPGPGAAAAAAAVAESDRVVLRQARNALEDLGLSERIAAVEAKRLVAQVVAALHGGDPGQVLGFADPGEVDDLLAVIAGRAEARQRRAQVVTAAGAAAGEVMVYLQFPDDPAGEVLARAERIAPGGGHDGTDG
jgi:hypothetical protein